MRNRGIRKLMIAGILLTISAAAYGQQYKVEAKVPFSFAVRGMTIPAGSYTIGRAFAGQPGMLILQGEHSGKTILYAPVNFDVKQGGGALVFHRYGEHYFLRAVKTPQGSYVLSESRQEKRIARGEQPAAVTMALSH